MLWGPSRRADRAVRPCKEFRRGRRPRPVLPHYHAIRRGGVLPRPREGKPAKRRQWRMKRAGFEEVPRLAGTTVPVSRLARRWAREPLPYAHHMEATAPGGQGRPPLQGISVGADAYIGPPHRSPCNVSLRGRSAPVAIRPPKGGRVSAGAQCIPVPHSKITAPLFFSARPERIRSRVSAKGSLVCSPVFISLQATTPAAISSSPRKIT